MQRVRICNASFRLFVSAILVFSMSLLCQAEQPNPTETAQTTAPDVLNMKKLAGMEHWDVVYRAQNGGVNQVRLHHFKWMMDFLHWRPLDDNRKKLDLPYVRHLLKTFWGPAMPFELTGVENTLTVNGHPAYEVEGTLQKGRIRTRFIVWNCPETHRQFIADININQAYKTPPGVFDVERKSALTITCHGKPYGKPGKAPLDSVYTNAGLGISFLRPATWKTNLFERKQWYPNGITKESGSLWTLLTDSEKSLHLFSWKADGKISADVLTTVLKKYMGAPFPVPDNAQWRIKEFNLATPIVGKGYVSASGQFTSEEKGTDWSEVKPHLVKAVLYDDGSRRYLLVATMTAWQEMWRHPVDLTPSQSVFENYILTQVKPAVKNWPANL